VVNYQILSPLAKEIALKIVQGEETNFHREWKYLLYLQEIFSVVIFTQTSVILSDSVNRVIIKKPQVVKPAAQ